MQEPTSERGGDAPRGSATAPESTAPLPSGLLAEIGQLGRALGNLFGAQWDLLAAELGLARSAVSWIFIAGLVATAAGVALALTLLALLGLALAKWFGSWLWALAALCLVQMLLLAGAVWLFRRCMHWMTLPATRDEWGAMMRDTLHKARQGSPVDTARAPAEDSSSGPSPDTAFGHQQDQGGSNMRPGDRT